MTIYSKTAKGMREASGKTKNLSSELRELLKLVNGKASLDELREQLDDDDQDALEPCISSLVEEGYIHELESSDAPPTPPAQPARSSEKAAPVKSPPVSEAEEPAGDLDFFAMPPATAPSAPTPSPKETKQASPGADDQAAKALADDKALKEALERARVAAKEKLEQAAEQRAAAEAKASRDAEEAAKVAAAETKRKDAEEKAKRAAEELAMRELQEQLRREAEEKAKLAAAAAKQREADEQARRAAAKRAEEEQRAAAERERQAQQKAADALAVKARQEAEEKARRDAEEKARRDAEEIVRRENEEREQREAAERLRIEAGQRAKKAFEEKQRREAEEKLKQEELEAARREEVERLRIETERLRAEVERQRFEAAARAKLEAEEKERAAAEARALREAAEREQAAAAEQQRLALAAKLELEEQERQRRVAEEKLQQEAAERARLAAEMEARAEAERAAQREDEARAQREAEEKSRREADEARRIEAERLAKEEAEVHERKLADERARAMADAAALAVIEEKQRSERDAQARLEAQAREQHEAEEKARRDAEEAKWRAEEFARREAELQLEREHIQREELEQLEADARSSRRIGKRGNWGKRIAFVIILVLVGGLGLIHVLSFDAQKLLFEQAASAQIGQPVKIRALHFALIPQAHWRAEEVSIGGGGQIRAASIKAQTSSTAVLGGGIITALSLDTVTVNEEGLAWLLFGKTQQSSVAFPRVTATNVNVSSSRLLLPVLDVTAELVPDGSWQKLIAQATDRKFLAEFERGTQAISLKIDSAGYAPPSSFSSESVNKAQSISLTDFRAIATLSERQLTVSEFSGGTLGGVLAGAARMTWDDGIRLSSEFNASRIGLATLLPSLFDTGMLSGNGAFVMSGTDLSSLRKSVRGDGSFVIERGQLRRVDLGKVLQGGGNSGKTLFSQMNGRFAYGEGKTQITGVKLTADLLSASGSAELAAENTLNGRFVVELKSTKMTVKGNLTVFGSITEPQFSH